MLASVGTNQPSLVMDYYKRETWSALSGHSNAFLASVDRLLSLVAKLSILSVPNPGLTRSGRVIEQSRLPEAVRIKFELEKWKPPKAIPEDARNTAEAMRHAALLFYYKLTSTSCAVTPAAEIEQSRRQIIQHLTVVKADSPAAASHLWPLYMAGCFLETNGTIDRDGQKFLRDRLTALKLKRGLITVDRVRERLELIWNRGDDGAMDLDAPLILI